jgi:hypothetical protein
MTGRGVNNVKKIISKKSMYKALYEVGRAAMASRATGDLLNPIWVGKIIDPVLYPKKK